MIRKRKRKRKPPRRRLNQPPKRTRQLIESRWRYLEGFRAYCRRLMALDLHNKEKSAYIMMITNDIEQMREVRDELARGESLEE